MITRIVKMTFLPEYITDFREIFYESQKLIRVFEGCISIELMVDLGNENSLFTISYWRSEKDLEAYRESYLFRNTWAKVKPMFSEKAQAWSLKEEKGKPEIGYRE